MEKEQWEIDKESILTAFNNHPPHRGVRNDGERYLRVSKEINNRWVDKRCIYYLETLVKAENPIYAMGLLKYNWPINTVIDSFRKKYFDHDPDNIIINLLLNEEETNIRELIKVYKSHYKEYSDSILYLISFTLDGEPLKYKKVGKTLRASSRFPAIQLKVPFEISKIKTWEVQADKLDFVESHLKGFLKPYHKNGEFFKDTDDTLFNIISKELINLKNDHDIYIEEKK